MSADRPPLYALIDRRQDGNPRIVSEHLDPQSARAAADLLRSVGDPIEIVLVSAIHGAADVHVAGEPKRSAANWFLDAHTYTLDGNIADALAAARAGIRALQELYAT